MHRRFLKTSPIFSAKSLQTVRKLAIGAETLDQIANFGVKLNSERSQASIFDAALEARTESREFSHALADFCAAESRRCNLLRGRDRG